MLNIHIHNIGGTKFVANYEYQVLINSHIIAEGKIENFKRSLGWKELVKKVIEDERMLEEE